MGSHENRIKLMILMSKQYIFYIGKNILAQDGTFFQSKIVNNFLSSPRKHIFWIGTHSKRLAEALLMSTHNICLRGEIRGIFSWHTLSWSYDYVDISLI